MKNKAVLFSVVLVAVASLAAALTLSAALYALWVRAGRPRGVAGALADVEAPPQEPVGQSPA